MVKLHTPQIYKIYKCDAKPEQWCHKLFLYTGINHHLSKKYEKALILQESTTLSYQNWIEYQLSREGNEWQRGQHVIKFILSSFCGPQVYRERCHIWLFQEHLWPTQSVRCPRHSLFYSEYIISSAGIFCIMIFVLCAEEIVQNAKITCNRSGLPHLHQMSSLVKGDGPRIIECLCHAY